MDATQRRWISFAWNLWISTGTRADWPYFARWHYRSHHLGAVRHVTLLWHADQDLAQRRKEAKAAQSADEACGIYAEPGTTKSSPSSFANLGASAPWRQVPVGICVFTSAPVSLRQRNRFFGLSGTWSRTKLRTLDRRIVMLSRVVLHPTYRGAGIAAPFIRKSCRTCPWPWIETLTQMGHINPFFEKAGFQRVGVSRHKSATRKGHSALYGGRKRLLSQETHHKSRHAEPVYYIFDNRHTLSPA